MKRRWIDLRDLRLRYRWNDDAEKMEVQKRLPERKGYADDVQQLDAAAFLQVTGAGPVEARTAGASESFVRALGTQPGPGGWIAPPGLGVRFRWHPASECLEVQVACTSGPGWKADTHMETPARFALRGFSAAETRRAGASEAYVRAMLRAQEG